MPPLTDERRAAVGASIRAIPEDGVEEEDGGEADGGGASGGEPAHQTDASVAVAGLVGGVALGPPSPLTAVVLRPGLFRVSAVVGRGAGGQPAPSFGKAPGVTAIHEHPDRFARGGLGRRLVPAAGSLGGVD